VLLRVRSCRCCLFLVCRVRAQTEPDNPCCTASELHTPEVHRATCARDVTGGDCGVIRSAGAHGLVVGEHRAGSSSRSSSNAGPVPARPWRSHGGLSRRGPQLRPQAATDENGAPDRCIESPRMISPSDRAAVWSLALTVTAWRLAASATTASGLGTVKGRSRPRARVGSSSTRWWASIWSPRSSVSTPISSGTSAAAGPASPRRPLAPHRRQGSPRAPAWPVGRLGACRPAGERLRPRSARLGRFRGLPRGDGRLGPRPAGRSGPGGMGRAGDRPHPRGAATASGERVRRGGRGEPGSTPRQGPGFAL
jgi:hypothetical protein